MFTIATMRYLPLLFLTACGARLSAAGPAISHVKLTTASASRDAAADTEFLSAKERVIQAIPPEDVQAVRRCNDGRDVSVRVTYQADGTISFAKPPYVSNERRAQYLNQGRQLPPAWRTIAPTTPDVAACAIDVLNARNIHVDVATSGVFLHTFRTVAG